ncbi:putative E3 ubiquitin-protein ligase UNKL isoform X1 [Phyllopteryx taeniolatus]|uniref:putative E3 ubiquitin-protein ligase UNKL isoform X1 n=1 Tax=Phyllopteryx taeniolatus TaxID=161469 RepID=UPI002AD35F84|nr:putative E3 ubiquitin-protein ligase UNKL isoform X1 [Phyllopteryx taeniolatus]XP_061606357.1 putative E3 ubiquitin-protein ligase UNKL isoform X1 [Phyllopteryx taeniolatus]
MPSVSKTAANASPQNEKPTHYTYLKEFRTEQCPLFLQHKCTQHRPFTCFHWHFLNQRRRRPIRRRDGTFNYSPDVYCTKYDETTGICPDGDDCPYLHRTTGDTERKYHLRYYKTGTCIHETDARGHCVKNGLHCAFAHGPHDLRPSVYDIREIQAQEALQNGQLGSGEGIPDQQPGVLASQAMIDKTLTEDPRWQDTNFVLANYKTEQCTKPPRLCRQGYACPHYHNSRDRRRNPRKYKYRSTPCPSVKHGDEWGEPSKCDSGDACQYCHSRMEQQFHPEIYKSTKCNDMRQTGYCPRGPFCAFAHVESLPSGIPSGEDTMSSLLTAMHSSSHCQPGSQQYCECPVGEWTTAVGSSTSNGQVASTQNSVFCAVNPLASSFTSSITSSLASSIGSDNSSPTTLSTMNAKATPFYPGSNTVESVIGSALDLNFSDINVASLDKELEEQDNNVGLESQRMLGGSAPVNIPGSLARSSSFNSSSSLSTSPLSSLSQSLLSAVSLHNHTANMLAKQEHSLLGTPTSSSQNSLGLNGASSIWDFVSGSFSQSPSPVFSSLTSAAGGGSGDVSRLFRELDEAKRKIKQCEEAWHQVKQACETCQKDAHEAKEQAKAAEVERQLAEQKRDETERKLKDLRGNFDALCRAPGAPLLRSYGELDQLPLSKLHSLKNQLRNDLDLIDGVIYLLQSKKCVVCQKHDRSIVLQPCQHYVLCESCASSKAECPYCRTKILKW